jgi:hypothetical protein
MGIHLHTNVLVTELEPGTLEPEILCCVHKLQELWQENVSWLKEISSFSRRVVVI